MPMQFMPPEVFLKYKGVTIYHVYKNDDVEQGTRTYWYGTSPAATDESDEHSFDVRALQTWDEECKTAFDEMKAIRKAIKKAIDLGVLKSTEA